MGRKSIAWWHEENIGQYELVKVRITDKVANYRVGATTYYPGDIVEVPEFAICDFMERVEPIVVEEPEPVVTEEPEPVVEEAPTKKKSTRKKVTEPEPAPEAETVDSTEESS